MPVRLEIDSAVVAAHCHATAIVALLTTSFSGGYDFPPGPTADCTVAMSQIAHPLVSFLDGYTWALCVFLPERARLTGRTR